MLGGGLDGGVQGELVFSALPSELAQSPQGHFDVSGVELDGIVARVRGKNYGLRSLVHEIVQSRLFREK